MKKMFKKVIIATILASSLPVSAVFAESTETLTPVTETSSEIQTTSATATIDCSKVENFARPECANTSTNSNTSINGGGSQPVSELQSAILVTGGSNSANGGTNVTVRDNFLKNIQRYMIGLLGIIAVAVFVYIGYNLVTAKGNEEEFKKAWLALVYACIGLALIPLAFILVKITSGFTL